MLTQKEKATLSNTMCGSDKDVVYSLKEKGYVKNISRGENENTFFFDLTEKGETWVNGICMVI